MPGPAILHTPVVDGYVLTERISQCCRNGHTPAMPCMIGYTAQEGLAFAKDRRQLEEMIPQTLPRRGAEYLSLCP